ncbi:hypothetical protein BD560DRAFT_449971 [Blakeslea trispora]|nr:hypothetical protein BD560DRAFT_449971 [Blakeslea trispora]
MNIYTHFKQDFQSELSSIMFPRSSIHINALEANNADRTGSCIPPTQCEAKCSPGCGDDYVCVLSIMADCGICPLSKCLSRASLGLPPLPTSNQKDTSNTKARNPSNKSTQADSSDDLGTVVGSVVGALIGMGLIAAAAVFLYIKKSKSKKNQLPLAFANPSLPQLDDHVPPQTTLSIYTASKVEAEKEYVPSILQALPSDSSSRFMGFPQFPDPTNHSTQTRQRPPLNNMYSSTFATNNKDTNMHTLETDSSPRDSSHSHLPNNTIHAVPMSEEPSHLNHFEALRSSYVSQKPLYSNSVDQASLTTLDTHARQRRSYGSQGQGTLTAHSSPVSTDTRQNQIDSMRLELPSTDPFAQKSNSVIREMIMENYTTDSYNIQQFPAIPSNKSYYI